MEKRYTERVVFHKPDATLQITVSSILSKHDLIIVVNYEQLRPLAKCCLAISPEA